MAALYAFATLLTSDFYLPGALALAAALKDVHPTPAIPPEVDFQTVCLVTPETVDVSTIKLLRKAFNVVVGVEVIAQEDDKGLKLLGESAFPVYDDPQTRRLSVDVTATPAAQAFHIRYADLTPHDASERSRSVERYACSVAFA